MCHICQCFGLLLDVVQRAITFCLAWILCFSICVSMVAAITAGIAYGYNYSLAEFLTLKRQDISIYVKRGQFSDKLEIMPLFRRSGEEEDAFSSNRSTDYEDQYVRSDSRPLGEALQKAQDTQSYAEKLSIYSQDSQPAYYGPLPHPDLSGLKVERRLEEPQRDMLEQVPSPKSAQKAPERLSTARRIIPTRTLPGRPDIMMRNFGSEMTTGEYVANDPDIYRDEEFYNENYKTKDDKSKSQIQNIPMRHWGITKAPVGVGDNPPPDVDEDNVVYKPI